MKVNFTFVVPILFPIHFHMEPLKTEDYIIQLMHSFEVNIRINYQPENVMSTKARVD